MQAYIDDSQEDGRVLVYGGLIASADQWKAFSKDWQQCLDDAPWDVFKMKKVSRQWRRKKLRACAKALPSGVRACAGRDLLCRSA